MFCRIALLGRGILAVRKLSSVLESPVTEPPMTESLRDKAPIGAGHKGPIVGPHGHGGPRRAYATACCSAAQSSSCLGACRRTSTWAPAPPRRQGPQPCAETVSNCLSPSTPSSDLSSQICQNAVGGASCFRHPAPASRMGIFYSVCRRTSGCLRFPTRTTVRGGGVAPQW